MSKEAPKYDNNKKIDFVTTSKAEDTKEKSHDYSIKNNMAKQRIRSETINRDREACSAEEVMRYSQSYGLTLLSDAFQGITDSFLSINDNHKSSFG